jgi:hypothetical protein
VLALPRAFVGFSSTDILSYRVMCAWQAREHIAFQFCDCQHTDAILSHSEAYIKSRCRDRLDRAGTYILLIGSDTRLRETYVKWEVEVAIEKKCRLIGVNLDFWRYQNPATCPPVLRAAGAVFVPFSPQIIQFTLEHWTRPLQTGCYYYYDDSVYTNLGYVLNGYIATRPPNAIVRRSAALAI